MQQWVMLVCSQSAGAGQRRTCGPGVDVAAADASVADLDVLVLCRCSPAPPLPHGWMQQWLSCGSATPTLRSCVRTGPSKCFRTGCLAPSTK